MKNLNFFSLIIIWIFCFSGIYSQPPTPDVFIQGIFVDSIGEDLYTQGKIENLIPKLREYFFNAVFPQVRIYGRVLYQSNLEPLAIASIGNFTDPLLALITTTTSTTLERNGFYIFPWVNVIEGYPSEYRNPPFSEHILARHPEWKMLDKDGKSETIEQVIMVDPLIPAAQTYILALLSELAQRYYKVQGIYINDFCFPEKGSNWGYNPITIALFNKDLNKEGKPNPDDSDWCEWRRKKMTGFLEKIHNTLKKVRPDIIIAIGISAEGEPPKSIAEYEKSVPYSERMQDFISWTKQGLVDIIVLKNYFSDIRNKSNFDGWLEFVNKNKNKASIIVAVDGRKNFTNSIIDQLRRIRVARTRGAIIYQYREPVRDSSSLLYSSLSRTVFKEKFLNIRNSGIVYEPAVPLRQDKKTTATLAIDMRTTGTLSKDMKTTTTSSTAMKPEVTSAEVALAKPTPAPLKVVQPTPAQPTPSKPISPTPVSSIDLMLAEKKLMPDIEIKSLPKPVLTSSATPTPKPTPTLLPFVTPAPQKWDKIYLTNGSVFEGRLIEEVEGTAIIESKDGFQLRIKVSEIEKIVKIVD